VTNNLSDISRIAELLRYSTNRKVVEDFLRSKGLQHSASNWEEFIAKRIIPSVENNELHENDFLALLSSVEEYGKQHIFLYSCPPEIAENLLSETRVLQELRSAKWETLIESPLALDTPDVPTVVDVRLEKAAVPLSLTIKEVYTHRAYKPDSSKEVGDQLIKTWRIIRTRAVNIAKLHRDGLLEIRLASVTESSYKEQRERFLHQLVNMIPIHQFNPITFAPAKNKLSSNKQELSQTLRFADTILKNENGTTFKVSSGSVSDDLAADEGAIESEGGFLRHNGAYAEGQNFFIKAVPDSLSKEILILMSGEPHEFGVMANCSEADYSYVLGELRKLNG